MASFKCPFCDTVMSLDSSTISREVVPFFNGQRAECKVKLTFYRCPHCEKFTIIAKSESERLDTFETCIHPMVLCNHYPEYIPEAIRADYEEACAIRTLSPKACATLCRRCLQGMIRDFWKIKEKDLFHEIEALHGKIMADQWEAISALRRIGNIGAHMEKDVNLIIDIDPEEAEKLIRFIEYLMEAWYINREKTKKLFGSISTIDEGTQAQRKAT